ncbi:MAG TPA: Asp-tRNA(Asn)/Glu-tRNA(Gln) amidotransferase subunit GatA, partial [Acetobacteraceae bacterium]|nr:Asp-tRNA(Asn)/Glu-tRNA(Gln) amidotransferase subunit GatA [Acetobacteraceae bacterium]
MTLTDLGIAAARHGLGRREFSARELALAHIAAIEALNPRLNAFITVTAEQALAAADEADEALARGEGGPLAGIPLAIKDIFCTRGVRTTAGSRILGPFVPPYESAVTANLLRDGAIFLGKTNLDEFAMGSSTTSSAYGSTENPWKRRQNPEARLVPGGSSGGSAAAVAARLALGATGTDTGGSIRQPASFCGITGIKPTYGRCSRWGVVAFASSLDHPGPFGRGVEDCALLLRSMAGHDPRDSTSVDRPVPDYAAACRRSLKGLRIGVPREYRVPGMAAGIEEMWRAGESWLREAGAEITEVSLPHTEFGLPTYYIIAPAEASSNLARYDGVRFGLRRDGEDLIDLYERTRGEGFGAEVKRRILMGTYVLSHGYYDAYYLKAQKVRRLIYDDFRRAFESVDLVLGPTAQSVAFKLGDKA